MNGKRKTSKAFACFVKGKGEIEINGKNPSLFFKEQKLLDNFNQTIDKLFPNKLPSGKNILIRVSGGGSSSQIFAILQSLGNLCVEMNPERKSELKEWIGGDPRNKQRFTPGKPGRRASYPYRRR